MKANIKRIGKIGALCGGIGICGVLVWLYSQELPTRTLPSGDARGKSAALDHRPGGSSFSQSARRDFKVGIDNSPRQGRPPWKESRLPIANIGFGRLMADVDIIALLNNHDVTPRAFFFRSPSGLTGAYRIYNQEEIDDPEDALEKARAQTAESMRNGLKGNLTRAKHFTDQYTENEVITNADLERDARALLSLRESFEVTRDTVESGEPFIYSMEVEGTDGQLTLIEDDPRSQDFATEPDNQRGGVPRTEKPFPQEDGPYVAPDVETMDIEDVYQELVDLGDQAPDIPMTIQTIPRENSK